ncbi:MAG TPA: hypothetical protein VMT38_13055 [Terracidiphilus sp.]|nr:hypothetical protein [Terracidiphilus sp.]
MHRANAKNNESLSKERNALGWTAAVYGIYAGMLGVEHGFFETLQGNRAPAHVRIFAASWELPFPFGHEPAMTLIPNYMATGIAAMLCGLAICVWSSRFMRGKRGAAVLALLSVVLLLVGGGFGPISLLIVSCIAASCIGMPLKKRQSLSPFGLVHALARAWPWILLASLLWVPLEFAFGQFFHLQNDHRQSLSNLNLLLSYPMLCLFVLTLASSLAQEAERQSFSKNAKGGG